MLVLQKLKRKTPGNKHKIRWASCYSSSDPNACEDAEINRISLWQRKSYYDERSKNKYSRKEGRNSAYKSPKYEHRNRYRDYKESTSDSSRICITTIDGLIPRMDSHLGVMSNVVTVVVMITGYVVVM